MKDSLPKVIYVMGPPGAGKGTQAKLLAEELDYHQFSTGSAFRDLAAQDTDLGRQVKEIIDSGYLMPPEKAAEVVMKAVEDHLSKGQGLIFDGTPRTKKEAAMVGSFFVDKKYGDPLPIFLTVDKDEMMARNAKRRYCVVMEGADFPVVTLEDEKRCSAMGGEVGRRADDDPEKFATRWSEFIELTLPVVKNYRARGILQEVNGMKTVEEVHEAVMGVISEVRR